MGKVNINNDELHKKNSHELDNQKIVKDLINIKSEANFQTDEYISSKTNESVVFISKEKPFISFNEILEMQNYRNLSSNNQGKFDMDIRFTDDNLKFEKVENDKVIFQNEGEKYSVEATPLENGLQIMFNIENVGSPHRYEVDLDIPQGSKIEVDEFNNYYIVDSYGEVQMLIGSAWAVDANGELVETRYEIVENKLIQHIDYNGDSYPLKADPLFCYDLINNKKTFWIDRDGVKSFSIKPRACTRAYLASRYLMPIANLNIIEGLKNTAYISKMWYEVKKDGDYKNTHNNTGMRDQFICHAVNPTTLFKGAWNIEPHREDIGIVKTYLALCNP